MGHQEKEKEYRVSESECVLTLVEELLKAEGKEEEIELQFNFIDGSPKGYAPKRP